MWRRGAVAAMRDVVAVRSGASSGRLHARPVAFSHLSASIPATAPRMGVNWSGICELSQWAPRRSLHATARAWDASGKQGADAAAEATGEAAGESEAGRGAGEGDGGDGGGGEGAGESRFSKLVNDGIGVLIAAAVAVSGYKLYRLTTLWPAPCEQMVELAKSSDTIKRVLGGDDFSVSMFWDGSFGETTMSVRIPVTGQNGVKGVLHGRAVLVEGQWHLLSCAMMLDKDARQDLRDRDEAEPEAKVLAGVGPLGVIDVLEERMRAAGALKPRVPPSEMIGHGVAKHPPPAEVELRKKMEQSK